MGKGCDHRSEFSVRALDPEKAAADTPVELCRSCLGTDATVVDFFRWARRSADGSVATSG